MDNKENFNDMENINDDKNKEKRELKPGLNREYFFIAVAGIIVGAILRFLI